MNDANAQCPEEFTGLSVGEPKTKAVGMPAVVSSLNMCGARRGWFAERKPCACSIKWAASIARVVPGPIRTSIAASASFARTEPRRSRGKRTRRNDDGRTVSPNEHRRTRQVERLRARPTGPAGRADGVAARLAALRTDLVGRSVRAHREGIERAGFAGRSDLLHVRPNVERSGVSLPAFRPAVRHEQPAGLLEHVPRVVRLGPHVHHRHRQGHGDARRL